MSETQWTTVATEGNFAADDRVRADVDGTALTVFRVEGEYYAIADQCTHARASLSQGLLVGKTVMCPLHGAAFDLATGAALTLPAVQGVKTFPVRVEDGAVQVSLGGDS
jgi:3-phenylpropionate/trans-cinnamate dioxygenase ferredoxin component